MKLEILGKSHWKNNPDILGFLFWRIKMAWKLWLDDQAYDPDTPNRHSPGEFVAATSTAEALTLILVRGLPEFIDFDHDLGGDDTAMRLLRWLERNFYLDTLKPFDYQIHSANPIGAANIISFMDSWKKIYELDGELEWR
jgi:hypothetical protein